MKRYSKFLSLVLRHRPQKVGIRLDPAGWAPVDDLLEGLRPMDRHHVHLSPDRATARQVGSRRGTPVVLVVEARRLWQQGVRFYRTPNGVWLVDEVPAGFLSR